jgi:adenylate cyclase
VSGAESDDELIAAVRRAGNVVLLADAVFEGLQNDSSSLTSCGKPSPPGTTYAPGAGLFSRPSVCLPFPALRNVAAAVGHNYLRKDPGSGASRAMFPFIESQGVAVPSLGLSAVLLAGQVPSDAVRLDGAALRVADVTLPLREEGELLLKLHGPSSEGESAFPIYPFFDVLLSEQRASEGLSPAIPESAFAGKIVFVGTSATGLADVHATAFGGSTPGAHLQATLADNVLGGEFMRRAPPIADVALTAIAGLVAGVAAATLPVWWALAGLVAVMTVFLAWATRAVGDGLWAPVVAPVAAAAVSLTGGLAWQYFVEGREKRRIGRLFGRYVSPDIFAELMSNPSAVRIGGERRNMTVLFSDIRGFTSASEAGSPEAVVGQLNEYFGEMVNVLFRHRGTLDKFVGDQVMALFGAPAADPQHADHAVAAAIEMGAALDNLNARWKADGRPAFAIGIGVNSGEMIAGNVGSEAIMSYTVIGDAVNLGARIESLNKDFGTRILISQATKDGLTMDVPTRRIGEVTVKGRREPVVVHEVIARERSEEQR